MRQDLTANLLFFEISGDTQTNVYSTDSDTPQKLIEQTGEEE